MSDDELKDIWAQQSEDVALSPERVWRLAKASEGFERTIFWRDAREWIATMVVAGFFFYSALAQRTVHWRLVLAALLACLPLTYVAISRRKRPDPSSYRSLTDHLRDSIGSVQHQIRLLRSVQWWYLAPCALGILLVFFDLRKWQQGLMHTFLFLSFGIVLFIGVWKLNQHAVRTDLEPRLRKLKEALVELEK